MFVLFYNMRIVCLYLNTSANLVIDECNIFWTKVRFLTQKFYKCKLKPKKLYEIWQNLSKNINKMSEVLINKCLEFLNSMNCLIHSNCS